MPPHPKPPKREPKPKKPLKRTWVKRYRSKPRRGRLRGKQMSALWEAAWERDEGVCQRCLLPVLPEEGVLSHRKGKRMWGDHLDNVQIEHDACHKRFHANGPTLEKPCKAKERAQ